MRVDRDLDPISVGVQQVRGVIGGTVLGAASRRSVIRATRGNAGLPRCLDCRHPAGGEAEVASPRSRWTAIGGEEHGLDDAPADQLAGLHLPPPAERTHNGVIETRATVEL